MKTLRRRAFTTRAWLPGSGGAGVANVLFRTRDGGVNADFTGKPSFGWPVTPPQTPLNRGDPDYRPLFPYGLGLTYAVADTPPDTLPEVDTSVAR